MSAVPRNRGMTTIAGQRLVSTVQAEWSLVVIERARRERVVGVTSPTIDITILFRGGTRVVDVRMASAASIGDRPIPDGPTVTIREDPVFEHVALMAIGPGVLAKKLVTGISVVLKL